MGDEAWGGDRRPAETAGAADAVEPGSAPGRTERVPGEAAEAAPPRKGGGREGRLVLSVPQVAGSAVAAVVAAKLASNLGVYGTIVGAGVVSVLATCGGTVLQHVFQRTGRRVQEAAVQVRRPQPTPYAGTPRLRLPAEDATAHLLPPTASTAGHPLLAGSPTAGEPGDTTPFTGANPDLTPGAGHLTAGTFTAGRHVDTTATPDLTLGTGHPTTGPFTAGRHVDTTATPDLAPTALFTGADPGPDGPDGYSAPTSYRVRRRGWGWKRPVVAVGLAFGLTMGGITAYEALTGEDLSGSGHGTTIGNAFTGHTSSGSGGDHGDGRTSDGTGTGTGTGTGGTDSTDGTGGNRDTAPTPSTTPHDRPTTAPSTSPPASTPTPADPTTPPPATTSPSPDPTATTTAPAGGDADAEPTP